MLRVIKFLRLFRMILHPAVKPDTRRIEGMGLLAVKIAQMYAMRADLLGVEKATILSRLYEQRTPMAAVDFLKQVELLSPPAFQDALERVEHEPLAAASLGQVHRAWLKNGEAVVVKILREDHAAEFRRDVRAMRFLARAALIFRPALARLADPLGTLAIIERLTMKEMNLLEEARGAARMESLRSDGAQRLDHLQLLEFSRVRTEFSTEHFLVTDYVPHPTLRKLLESKTFRYENLLLLFRIHGYFLFHKGEFHGDLHPGNVMFDGTRFTLIDNANVEKIPSAIAQGILRFMNCLGRGDIVAAAAAIASLSVSPMPRQEEFSEKFIILYENFGGKPVGEQSLTVQMMKTIRLAVEHGLDFPQGAFSLIKSLMYLDGMAVACAPEQFLLDDVARFADDFS